MKKFNEKDFKAMTEQERNWAKEMFDTIGVMQIYYDPSETIDPNNDSRLKKKSKIVAERRVKIRKNECISVNHNHVENTTITKTAKDDFDLIYQRHFIVRGFIEMGLLQIERVWYEEDMAPECRDKIEIKIT